MRAVLPLLVLLLLFAPGLVAAYTIIGDSVTYSNEWGAITESPITLTKVSDTAYINITSNISGTINLDLALGFDTENVHPTEAYYWAINAPHDIPLYGYINETVTVTCPGDSAGIINESSVWCYYAANSTNISLYCPTPRSFPNAFSCSYNEEVYREVGTNTIYYDDWYDISDKFAVRDALGQRWYSIENVSFSQGQTRQLKVDVFVKPNSEGKYDLRLKRSSDTWEDAVNNMVPNVYLDPWYSNNYTMKRMISINNSATSDFTDFPVCFYFNTSADIAAGNARSDCNDYIFVNSSEDGALSHLIENGTCNTGATRFCFRSDINNALGAGQGNTTVYMYNNYSSAADSTKLCDVFTANYERVYFFDSRAPAATVNGEKMLDYSCTANATINGTSGRWAYATGSAWAWGPYDRYLKMPQGAGTSNVVYTTNPNLYSTGHSTTIIRAYFNSSGVGSQQALFSTNSRTTSPYGTSLYRDCDSAFCKLTLTGDQDSTKLQYAGILLSNDTWLYYGVQQTSTTQAEIFINGASATSGAFAGTVYNGLELAIGRRYLAVGGAYDNAYWGYGNAGSHISEFRMTSDTKTDDWVKAETGALQVNVYDPEYISGGGGSAPVANEATLCNSSACSVLGTLYIGSNTLNCSGNVSDTDNATVKEVLFTYYRNATAFTQYITYNRPESELSYANATVASAYLKKGDTWRCEVNGYDGENNGTGLNSTAYTVNNTAPTLSAPALNDSYPPATGSLSCSPSGYSDADSDPAGTAYYRWWVNGAEEAGQTSSTLDLDAIGANEGDLVNCSTKQEDSGYSPKNSTETFSIAATVGGAPSVSSVELTKQPACSAIGTPYTNTVLTCKATPSDPDSAVLNVTYAFYRNSTHYQNATALNIPANASYCSYSEISISDTVVKKGDTWYCSVRAFDGLYYSAWVDGAAATINNTAPSETTPTLNDSSPLKNQSIACIAGTYSDADNDPKGADNYRWWVNGAEEAGQTSSTLDLDAIGANYGDFINCSVIPTDSGYDIKNGTERYSGAAKVEAPPWTTSTTLCNGTACSALTVVYVTTPLNCSTYVYDNDTTTITTLRIDYELNGSTDHYCETNNVANASLQYASCALWENPSPLTLVYFAKSDNVHCESRAYDGVYYSSFLPSTVFTVNNSAPSINAPTLDTYNPSNTTVINCTGAVGYADADGDALNITYYRWWKNGANLSENSSSLDLSAEGASDGDVIYCENWVTDSGYDIKASARYNSSPATVGIVTPPEITNCSSGFNVLNFTVLDEQTFSLIYATMEASFTLYNYTGGEYLSNVSFYIQNQTSFAYCINPYAALTIVSSYQTYYPFEGTDYTQRNYYLFNATLDASSPQQINIYLLNSSVSTEYTFQVVNQYIVPISGVKLSMYRFMPTINAWVIIEQKVTDFSGYALFDLQPGTLYKLVAEASGYVTLNTDFTPGAVTSIQIRMQQDGGTITPLPNFEQVFNDVSYSILPAESYFNESAYAELQISSATSSLQNYSMVITRRYNGTTTVVYNTSVSTSPAGGILNYTASNDGEYTLTISFKHANYTNPYSPLPTKFFIGNSSGAALAKEELATGFMNAWAFYLFAVVCTMVAAGFALRYSPEASAGAGLVVLWIFTFLYPAGVIVTVGGVGISILYATVLTTIMVLAGMVLKWYI